jgi:hypothetical protein
MEDFAMAAATTTTSPEVPGLSLDDQRASRRSRRQLNRQLRLRDETSARLAELDMLASILRDAAEVIRGGWLQHSWFAYLDQQGRSRTVTAHNISEMTGRPVVGACLVGAVVQAGGGMAQLKTQTVQRALDLTWHTLFDSGADLDRWTAAPPVRVQHVQQLTRWNDHPSRTASQVKALLRDSAEAAQSQASQHRGRLEQQQH